MAAKSCSSCGHKDLEPGVLTDTGAHPGYGRWIRGKPETGMFGTPKLSGGVRMDVQAYRCTACNHLDLFVED
jgi:hypothetical protein